jgi:hypothetical protein
MEIMGSYTMHTQGSGIPEEDRRAFLKSCGRFAAVTPPAVTMLLSTSLTSGAIAKSGGGSGTKVKGNNGFGNGANGTNPGSFSGNGVPQGGPGAGQSSSGSKGANIIR